MKHIQSYLLLFVIFLFLISISLYSSLDNSFFNSASAVLGNNKYMNDYNMTTTDKIKKVHDIQSQREVLGIIQNGTFVEAETKLSFKLTNIGILEELLPETGLLNLSNYEGKVILVSNQKINDEWIWSAKITDIANPILTKIFKKIFNFK